MEFEGEFCPWNFFCPLIPYQPLMTSKEASVSFDYTGEKSCLPD
jgi:hypothetical protein